MWIAKHAIALGAALTLTVAVEVQAQTISVPMHMVDSAGSTKSIGVITVTSTADGVIFTPKLEGLLPGPHGFHVHEKASCDPATDPKTGKAMPAQAAGGHLDPGKTSRHEGPSGSGHLGDLPVLMADATGKANSPVVAPRLKMSDLSGHSLMIHAGGDNYSDSPKELGGGGARIACGVIPS
jgi:Cu-Zn family superoxide dismutase